MNPRNLLPVAMLVAAYSACAAQAADPVKDYPSRPVRFVLPNPPGSANDTINRI